MATETIFVKELRDLINRHSMENGSNTPDFLLSAFLGDVLSALDDLVRARDSWYGVDLQPGGYSSETMRGVTYKLVRSEGYTNRIISWGRHTVKVENWKDTEPEKKSTFYTIPEKLQELFRTCEAYACEPEKADKVTMIKSGLRFKNRHMPGHNFKVISFNRWLNTLSVEITGDNGTWVEDDWALRETAWAFERGDYWPIATEAEQRQRAGAAGQIASLNDINRETPDGRLLFAALAKLTTESQTDKTPDQVIAQLNEFADAMDRGEEQHRANWDKTMHEMKLAEKRRSTPNVR